MLICHECQFENPSNHKFCQNCGSLLSQRLCCECGTNIANNVEKCHECGAVCGAVRIALITKNDLQQDLVGVSLELRTTKVDHSSMVCHYLDSQKRYQLLEPLPTLDEISTPEGIHIRVLDCQPNQITPLQAIITNQAQNLSPSSMIDREGITPLAQAYIAMQSRSYRGTPKIHDAWQQDGIQVILLQYRSHWQSLLTFWQEDSTTSLQRLEYFYQMTIFWEKLAPLNACYSLLELSNFFLDEDKFLSLQRLYIGRKKSTKEFNRQELNKTPTIQDLGELWQNLFRKSQQTKFSSIFDLLADLEQGKIGTIRDIQSRLADLSQKLRENTSEFAEQNIIEENLIHSESITTETVTVLQQDKNNDTRTIANAIYEDLATITTPIELSNLDDAGYTNAGKQRTHNEDCFGIETQISKVELPTSRTIAARGLYILCDGMGGHSSGEVASNLAVNTLKDYFQFHWTEKKIPSREVIYQGVITANQTIYDVNQNDARCGVDRMGTTLVLLIIQDNKVGVAHVGDSRLYRLTRRQGLEQITVDHEVGQREISRGVEPDIAYARPDAYQLTQAIGPRDSTSITPDIKFLEINEDTLFILVSDGLSDNDVLVKHWETHLFPLLTSNANLDIGVKNLIDLANQYNGHDNITAVLVRAKVSLVRRNQS